MRAVGFLRAGRARQTVLEKTGRRPNATRVCELVLSKEEINFSYL